MADLITPSMIARRALAALYNTTVLAALVYRDFDPDFAGKQGDTITVRTPWTPTVNEFDRATGIVLQNVDEGSLTVTLDTLVDVSFPITTEELTLGLDEFSTRLIEPAMEAISQKVDADLAAALVAAAGAQTAARASGEPASAALLKARTILSTNKLPATDRAAVLSPEATQEALSDPLFQQADRSGSTDALREASIGKAFGMDTYEEQGFTDADGVAFHRDAVALVSRTLQKPIGVGDEQAAVENYNGLGMRVVYDYDIDKKQDVVSVDFLYGIKALRPTAAVALDLSPVA